jgi:DMSO/TMAO reductase YedYZ molybdopterin-dependent catalytic subunit
MIRFLKYTRLQLLILIMFILIAFGNNLITIKTIRADDDIPITPNDEFFINSIDFFDIDPDEYRLIVTGEVTNPLSLSLDEIKAMPITSEIVRLTCIEHTFGARDRTAVANWTGVKLSHLLDMAEINQDKAIDISMHTPDLSAEGYSTSLNLTEAYWDDVILAYEMNEEPLPQEHGFPLRLVCPRMFGYKWIKWLVYINVTTIDYQGFWESYGYDDSPLINIKNLPIYYPVTSNSEVPPISEQRSPWLGFGTFFAALTTLTLSRLRKKNIRDLNSSKRIN